MRTTYRSFAKVNLHLEVLGRRPDGYHELETVFQTVGLHDEIVVEPLESGIELRVEGTATPAGPENLVHRAAVAFLERWGRGGVSMTLRKRIPVGAGLGGGSSDAATVLLALRDLHGTPDEIAALQPVAASLGADVPYFLVGGTAVGTERGDRVEAVPDLAMQAVSVVTPPVFVSTREVFSRYRLPVEPGREASDSGLLGRLRGGRLARPDEVVGRNDLEATVRRLFPPVDRVYTALVQLEARSVQVSGSGGSLFAFFATPPDASRIEAALPRGTVVHETCTLDRRSVERQRIVTPEGGAQPCR